MKREISRIIVIVAAAGLAIGVFFAVRSPSSGGAPRGGDGGEAPAGASRSVSGAAPGAAVAAAAGSGKAPGPAELSAIYDRFVGGQMSNEEMSRFLAEDIQNRRIGPAEAELLVRLVEHPGLTPDAMVGAERLSLAIMSDRLRKGEVTPRVRPLLEDAIERALSSPVWRLRRVAMIVSIEADLHVKRPSVNARIRSMTADPVPQVSERAKQIIRHHLDPPPSGTSTGERP